MLFIGISLDNRVWEKFVKLRIKNQAQCQEMWENGEKLWMKEEIKCSSLLDKLDHDLRKTKKVLVLKNLGHNNVCIHSDRLIPNKLYI